MCMFSLVLAYVRGYTFVCICMYLCVYVFAKGCTFVPLSVCAGREWGSVVCFVCRRPRMLSRLQLETAMGNVQCRKQQEQATYKLKGYTLKTSTFTLASSSMSSRAMKQGINMCILLGCQSEQEVQGIFLVDLNTYFFSDELLYIHYRLVWFQRKLTIHFTVFKLAPAPLTRTQRATAATKYSMHILPLLPPFTLRKVHEVKQANKINISRTCNTEQQEAQQNTFWRCILGAGYHWLSL